jgi:hypothetical protein
MTRESWGHRFGRFGEVSSDLGERRVRCLLVFGRRRHEDTARQLTNEIDMDDQGRFGAVFTQRTAKVNYVSWRCGQKGPTAATHHQQQ